MAEKHPYRYPNLAAEMSRCNLDYGVMYNELASEFHKSSDTISNWITGRAGELPTKVAFAIKERYFPQFTVDYLFSEQPIFDQSSTS